MRDGTTMVHGPFASSAAQMFGILEPRWVALWLLAVVEWEEKPKFRV